MMNLCIFCAREKRYVGYNMVKLFVVSIYSILSVGQMLHTSEKVMINQRLFSEMDKVVIILNQVLSIALC